MNIPTRHSLRTSIRLWTVTTTLVGYAICLHANASCNNSSWQGAYVVVLNGFRTFEQPPQLIGAFSPVAIVGTFTFDGAGAVQRSITVNSGGLNFSIVDSGTYTANADCSGTASFSDFGEAFSLAAVDSDTISLVTATPGESGAGTLVKQRVHSCDPRRLQGTYVFNGGGGRIPGSTCSGGWILPSRGFRLLGLRW